MVENKAKYISNDNSNLERKKSKRIEKLLKKRNINKLVNPKDIIKLDEDDFGKS